MNVISQKLGILIPRGSLYDEHTGDNTAIYSVSADTLVNLLERQGVADLFTILNKNKIEIKRIPK